MEWIATWFNEVTTFFQASWDFINSGIYTLCKDLLKVAVESYVYGLVKFKLFCLKLAYDVVVDLVQDSGAAAVIQTAWGGMTGDMQATLAFFNVPQGLSLIFAAFPTKFVMRFIPGASS